MPSELSDEQKRGLRDLADTLSYPGRTAENQARGRDLAAALDTLDERGRAEARAERVALQRVLAAADEEWGFSAEDRMRTTIQAFLDTSADRGEAAEARGASPERCPTCGSDSREVRGGRPADSPLDEGYLCNDDWHETAPVASPDKTRAEEALYCSACGLRRGETRCECCERIKYDTDKGWGTDIEGCEVCSDCIADFAAYEAESVSGDTEEGT